jgi:methionyl-tRNA synthetase
MPKRVPLLLTTPIYYANGAPHVGSAYTTIAADVVARAWKQQGRKVFLLTGTDEHGQKVADTAKSAGVTPQAFVDTQAKAFAQVFQRLNIGFDRFIRTTEADHVAGVQDFLKKLKAAITPLGRPAVYQGEYKGLYCQGCEKFLTEKELIEGKCPLHNTVPQELVEHNWFFRLTDYLPQLKKAITTHAFRVRPPTARKEVLGYFTQGIQDFSISRENVQWGIPLPWDTSQTAYVWVDALPNYLTGVGYGKNVRQYRQWWRGEVAHFMARDILKFHTIYWPALLMAVGEPLPATVFAHGYFTIDGRKMSKSLGNVIDPVDLVAKYGVDGTRYLLLTPFPFGQDGDLPVQRFTEKFNADLANGLGNLLSRTTNMVEQYCGGVVKSVDAPQSLKNAEQLTLMYDFTGSIASIWKVIAWANQAIDTAKPWALAKSTKPADAKKLQLLLAQLVAQLKEIHHAITPYLPTTAAAMAKALQAKKIVKASPLFQRVV